MTDTLLNLIREKYPLTEIDAGEMSTLKANGMTFIVKAYRAERLGHISVMRAKGFLGLMKMDTLIIHPKQVELPLYSYDRIYAMGNDTLIVELYDTLSGACDLGALDDVKNQYTDLAERDPGTHWYDSIKLPSSISKKGKKAQTGRFDQLAIQHLLAYLDIRNPAVSVEEKERKAAYYVDGLLTNGGPSTDVLKKSFGVEKTTRLFKNILFGTAE
ncbi:MAG: hypothetical protein IKY52_00015 [Clostridia bacterium]|nr:hypothetical protein [Clostridia bacterium]